MADVVVTLYKMAFLDSTVVAIWSMECELWIMEYGIWIMEYGVWIMEYGDA